MVRRSCLLLVGALACAALTACSSSSSSSSGSSGSSSGGGVDCSFTGSLSGGVSGSILADGCGTGPSSTFSIAQADLTAGTSLGARFKVITALKGGELGAIPLERFEIFQRESKAATSRTWSSTSCTLTLDRNEAAPTEVFKNRFLLAGHGSCSAGLQPDAPNTLPAVAVSSFQMTAFIDP
jgi:hypothetical protein